MTNETQKEPRRNLEELVDALKRCRPGAVLELGHYFPKRLKVEHSPWFAGDTSKTYISKEQEIPFMRVWWGCEGKGYMTIGSQEWPTNYKHIASAHLDGYGGVSICAGGGNVILSGD